MREGRAGAAAVPSDEAESLLLAEIQELAAEMAKAGAPESMAWSTRLQNLANDYCSSVTSEELDSELESDSAEPAKSNFPSPTEFMKLNLVKGSVDITTQIHELLEVFIAMDEGKYTRQHGDRYLERSAQLSKWATENQQTELAAVVDAGANDFRTIHNSPMDMDASLIQLIWGKLAPELSKWAPAPPSSAPSAGDKKSAAATPEENKNSKSDSAAKPESSGKAGNGNHGKARFVRVREEKLDEFLNHVSSLFITCELYKDIYTRLSDANTVPSLVEEVRQINRAFVQQTEHLQKGVVSLRRVTAAGLFSKFPTMCTHLGCSVGQKGRRTIDW